MGIKYLSKYLTNKRLKVRCDTKELSGQVLAIDMSQIFIHRYYNVSAKTAIKSLDIRVDKVDESVIYPGFISHLMLFLSRIIGYGILPILVFDGKPSPNKFDEHKKREKQSQRNRETMLDAIQEINSKEQIDITDEDIDRLTNLMSNASSPNKEIKQHIITICEKSGLPVIVAKYESDIVCATLVRKGIANAVYSEDTDMLAHLSERMITEIRSDYFLGYDLSDILSRMGMSKSDFRDYCIFSGCDYNGSGIRGYGPTRLMELLNEHGSFKAASKAIPSFKEMKIQCRYDICRSEFRKRKLRSIVDEKYLDFQLPESIIIHEDFEECVNFYCTIRSTRSYIKALNDMRSHLDSILQSKRG